jgi:hypothetical protein
MADAHTESERYREMANDIRAVVPMLKHPHTEAARDLRLLAIRYEKLANYLEEAEHGHLAPRNFGPVPRLQAG